MCKPYSCLWHKTKGVLRPKLAKNWLKHSHEFLIEDWKLKDIDLKHRDFVRIEVTPTDDQNWFTPVADWKFTVDEEGDLPDWFDRDYAEKKCRAAGAVFGVVCGMEEVRNTPAPVAAEPTRTPWDKLPPVEVAIREKRKLDQWRTPSGASTHGIIWDNDSWTGFVYLQEHHEWSPRAEVLANPETAKWYPCTQEAVREYLAGGGK